MHHLNRALQLNPGNQQTHQLVARLLAGAGHTQQAALEYRLALQHGLAPDYGELTRVLGHHVVDAVPQEPARLVGLATSLIGTGHDADAIAACARAGDLAPRREPLLVACTKLALDYNAPALLLPSAEPLAEEASEPESFVLAARARGQGGTRAGGGGADGARHQGPLRRRQPGLVAARLRLRRRRPGGGAALLARGGAGAFSLPQRAEPSAAGRHRRQGGRPGGGGGRARPGPDGRAATQGISFNQSEGLRK